MVHLLFVPYDVIAMENDAKVAYYISLCKLCLENSIFA